MADITLKSPLTGKQIGNVVKTLRGEAGFSQQEMAAKLGLKKGRLPQIENGYWGLVFEHLSRFTDICGYEFTIHFKKKK